jgi:hypothetical protein
MAAAFVSRIDLDTGNGAIDLDLETDMAFLVGVEIMA